MSTHIQRSALLPYPAQALFDLVNDVASYPQFLPSVYLRVARDGDGDGDGEIDLQTPDVYIRWRKWRNVMADEETGQVHAPKVIESHAVRHTAMPLSLRSYPVKTP